MGNAALGEPEETTAGIVIIGDEVLSGKVRDVNSPFLLKELYRQGVRAQRVVTIPDDVDVIAGEVRSASERFDFVLTSGGVGPTHDDLTFQGVAEAFGVPLHEDPTLSALLLRHFEDRLTQAARRMALVPVGTRLVQAGDTRFPLCVVRNVYVFPGVPEILKAKFEAVRQEFRGRPFHQVRVYTWQNETTLAACLEQTLDRFPGLAIGSYPTFDKREYRVMLTLESRDRQRLEEARDALLGLIDPAQIVRVEEPERAGAGPTGS